MIRGERSATVDQIQAGIKHRLETIDGLRAYAGEPDQLPGAASPIAYPRLVDWTYDEAYGMGEMIATLWHFDIWVVVDLAPGLARAQTQLNPFISPIGRRSVKQALECEATLGGLVDYSRLMGGGLYGQAEVAGVRCLAASMRAEVRA